MRLRPFIELGVDSADPPGIAGRIYLRKTFFSIKYSLRFPGSQPIEIFINWRGHIVGTVRGQTIKLLWEGLDLEQTERPFLAHSHDRLTLSKGFATEYRGAPVAFSREGARTVVRSGSEIVWVYRAAWKDQEMSSRVQAMVFVPEPAKLGEELDWWLFLALNFYASQMPHDQ